MKKLIWVTTVAQSMGLFKGQLKYLSEFFDLVFVSSNEKDPAELQRRGDAEGIKYHELPMAREISLFSDIKSLFLFIMYFIKEKPDAVHGNTPKGALLSMLAAKITGIKTRIYMCHGLRYQGCKGFKRKVLITMEKLTCMCATHVMCVSQGVRQTLNDEGICKFSKSILIGCGSCNGVDIAEFNSQLFSLEEQADLRNKYNIMKDDFLFIYMGRVVKDKGINELVRAFIRYYKENSRIKLMILGAFEDSLNPVDEDVALIIKNNQSGIIYCGKQTDVKPFLSLSQCLVLPSYREGFGLVLMEAGAMGVPVISTDIIGCNNVVTKDNGLLVSPEREDELYFAMKTMVENKELYKYFASSTSRSIIDRFEQKTLWLNFLNYYTEII